MSGADGKQYILIAGADAAFARIEESQVLVSSVLGSRFAAPVRRRAAQLAVDRDGIQGQL